jgi:FAD/FMN-containing dehydrogenase
MAWQVLDAGGRIYMMSIDLGGREFLARQFRDHFDQFASLKQRYDPCGLLNPGLFDVP